ncbi:ribosome biogenesis GTPase YlqF [Mycoplasma sp. 1018B]|uniref:ribosome biogenesis GTPase YlqF n=1 Tax=Mycoplasma sp. 1018B TaxID=2967302 RepID=UPI00211C3AB0|nr:ribosome biogenesis GTPase YlqF [Mycoplasma sp. 1018B]UUM19360.1 ribosome biogenesis GTPase YlqF [Mycoplasma sp. 1018B]
MQDNEILINWYPGHMAKAMKEIKEISNLVDLMIIILDARCPISSYNEDFDKIASNKKRLFIITKSDLMDTNKKELIKKRFQNETLLWLDLRNNKHKNTIINSINKMTKEKKLKDINKGFILSKIRVFVLGIPNAGKSTLINLISNKKTLKVANYPGVTRVKKWVSVNNMYFLDTPGILLPKFENQEAAIKLLMIGSIESKIFPNSFLAFNFLKILVKFYPEKVFNYWNEIIENKEIDDIDCHNFFSNVARKKNYKINNKLNLEKVYKEFIIWTKNLKGVTYD